MSDSQKECIIVLGMHRSGTSALTGLLSILGGDVGSDIMPPTEDNPKGYFENNYIYHLNRKILQEHKADWDVANFDFAVIKETKKQEYVEEAKAILKKEFRYIRRIVIKDPRVCLLFPIWEKALLDLNIQIKVILPIRSPIEVARSLQKRNDFTIEQGVHLWASHVFLAEKYSRPYEREHVYYPEDYSSIDALTKKLSALLNTTPSEEVLQQAKGFYTPSLAHHRVGFENISNLPEALTKLISLIRNKTLSEAGFDEVREQYFSEEAFYSQPYQKTYVEKEAALLSDQQALIDQRNKLQSENNAQVKHSGNLEKNLQALIESKKDLQDKYQTLADSKNDLAKKHQILAQSKNELQSRHQLLADSKNDLLKAHQILADSKNELQIKHLTLAESKNKLQRDHQILAESKNKLQKDHQKLTEEKNKLQKEHQALTEGKNRLQKDHQLLTESRNKLQKDHQTLADSKRELQNQYRSLVENNKALQKDHQALSETSGIAHSKLLTLTQSLDELRSLKQQHEALKKSKQVLEANQHVFKQKSGEKDAFIQRLKSDITKLLNKIDRIEHDYHKLRADRDSKNTQIEEKDVLTSYLSYRLANSDELIKEISTEPGNSKRLISHLNEHQLADAYQKRWYWPVERKPLATQRKRLIANSGLFSPIYYLTSYPDVRKSGVAPLEHFYKYGWKENRRPSEAFDLKGYLKAYPDVAQSGMNPLIHYLIHGKKEGRSPTPPKIQSAPKVIPAPKPRPVIEPTLTPAQKEPKEKASQPVPPPVIAQQNHYGPTMSREWHKKISLIGMLEDCDRDPNKAIPENIIHNLQGAIKADGCPLVSVIMPSWNRGDVIQQSIDSVLNQTYPNIELIISDDGSTDNTLSYIETKYAQAIASKKIKLIRNPHKGVCSTRNSGLKAATGELIAYLDSDNQWRKHFLLLMVSAFVENDELNCAYSALLVHDNNKQTTRILSTPYNRKQLLTSNFIDMNVFMHKASLYQQYGGFDESLTRLVDWELIIRYTRFYEPAHLPFIGVDYYLDHDKFNNITTTVGLDDNRNNVNKKHFFERVRYELESVRFAYILWDFPALSQTFVINELRWLVANNYDVNVYYAVDPDKAATLDFEVRSFQTKTPEELIPLLKEHNRNYCHSHFAYPAVTKLTWPACSELKLPFSFMPHAVDIFHHENQKRNHVGEIAQSPLCKKVFVHGPYHKNFLAEQGVPSEKMAYNFQAVNLDEFLSPANTAPSVMDSATSTQKIHKGIVLSRFVEKKGISSLIDAAVLLKDEPVCFELYGYGPLESSYRDQIEQLKLTNIRLMGALESKEEVRDLYANSDFLIAPCVEAQNGDRDGFPTVILEAFSMGMPVITTDIAAVPDYLTDEVQALIAPATNTKALAAKVKQLIRMPANRQQALTRQAQHFLQTKVGTHLSMSLLTDEWLDKRIDIFLVSFNNEQYDDEAETLEIIRRIFAYTTTPFTLTIIDNHSDESFWQNILRQVEGRNNVRLIRKEQNLMCGPSSNIALEMGDGEFAIYICAKEGFIAQHGWERALLNSMRENPDAALGGHHAHMPKYVYGHEYETHPDFSKYRNKDFLTGRLDKAFTHIQGGVFIIRREVFVKHGGFNPLIPHGGMDIELSFYYESLGYKLLEIPEVASLTVKTRPTLTAIMDENTVVAHPLTIESANKQLDAFVSKTIKQCNVCGWQGKSFENELHCPKCQSTPEGRLAYQYIASNYRIYRKGNALLLGQDKGLTDALSPLFSLEKNSEVTTPHKSNHFSCIVSLDSRPFNEDVYAMLENDGILVMVDDGTIDSKNLPPSYVYYDRHSSSIEYSWKRLIVIKKEH